MDKVLKPNTRRGLVVIFFIMCLTLLMPKTGNCQVCNVINSYEGNYLVEINGATYLAAPIETAKQSLKVKEELDAALKKLQAADSLLASYERVNASYENHFQLQNTLLEQTRQLYHGYKELAKDYKRIKGEPFLRLNAGVGALRDSEKDDYIPILLLGASAWRLNAWAFFNSRDSGFIFGANMPLRFKMPF